MGIRRRARECTVQLLYQFDSTHDDPSDILKSFWEMNEQKPARVVEMAENFFRESLERRKRIDGLIRSHSHHWQLERMSSVDRNILRLAVCEFLLGEETDSPVIINEALEIAKKYSGDDSSRFINGVLDSITEELRARRENPQSGNPEKEDDGDLPEKQSA